MTDDGQILYARSGDDWVLRVEGPLRYTNASSVDRFIDRLFNDARPTSVSVDLNGATTIDSTGIGLLAKIARGLARADGARPVVFSANPEINELLTSVCLDDVCCIVPSGAGMAPGEVAAIPVVPVEERVLARTIADAHRLLCELSEDNRVQFQQVVEAFDREAGRVP
ncbi:MAG: STAS domain-containing protein [Zoogloeaceae bacterium]|nr:STAS domain-containing protein [Zoogloeaceae bacterium]